MPNKRKRRSLAGFGDMQAMAFVRVGDYPTAGMADTGTSRTVIDAELASRAGAEYTNRKGKMNIAGHALRGRIAKVRIRASATTCEAVVEAFVPDAGQPFRKGLILGMDFLQAAKMRIDAETGEAYCPHVAKELGGAKRLKARK
jgi:predicted aspartyl protease